MLVFKTHVNRHQIRVPFGEDHLFWIHSDIKDATGDKSTYQKDIKT